MTIKEELELCNYNLLQFTNIVIFSKQDNE